MDCWREDSKVVHVDQRKFFFLDSQNIVVHYYSKSGWRILQLEGHSNKFEMPVLYRTCDFLNIFRVHLDSIWIGYKPDAGCEVVKYCHLSNCSTRSDTFGSGYLSSTVSSLNFR